MGFVCVCSVGRGGVDCLLNLFNYFPNITWVCKHQPQKPMGSAYVYVCVCAFVTPWFSGSLKMS